MGEIIRLADHRKRRRSDVLGARETVRAEFFFDLASPFTYLAAERVERGFNAVTWSPACARTLRCRSLPTNPAECDAVVKRAEQRAGVLRLPLAWPERWPAPVPAAMRVAHHAVQHGRGGAFALAAARLAFAGGFALDDPEILAEAAAAAGLPLNACLRAAREDRRDGAIEAAARRLLGVTADRLPTLSLGRRLYCGEDKIGSAATSARLYAAARR